VFGLYKAAKHGEYESRSGEGRVLARAICFNRVHRVF